MGGCAERFAIDLRDTEYTVLAEIAELVAALPAVKRQQALDQAAARYVDSSDHGHAACAALLERAGANLEAARQIQAERRNRGSFVVQDNRGQGDPG